MNKQQALDLLMLLSALESWSFSSKTPLPDYLHERIVSSVSSLEKIIVPADEAKPE